MCTVTGAANSMRYIDEAGTAVRNVDGLARLTNLAGLQRWGYVLVEPDPVGGGPDPPRSDWVIRPTRAGRNAQAVWRPLPAVIEARWQERYGAGAVEAVRESLRALVGQSDIELPRYLPVLWTGKTDVGDLQGWVRAASARSAGSAPDLSALLSQALLLFAVEFERESSLSLPVSANGLRVVDEQGVRARDLPGLAGVSREAASALVGFLGNRGCVAVGPDPAASRTKVVRLTAKGRKAQLEHLGLVAVVEERWRTRFGAAAIDSLRASLRDVIDQRDGDQPLLSAGLRPYPDGWRAHPPYLAQTKAMLSDPAAALPHYPMVLHRGGFPDGS